MYLVDDIIIEKIIKYIPITTIIYARLSPSMRLHKLKEVIPTIDVSYLEKMKQYINKDGDDEQIYTPTIEKYELDYNATPVVSYDEDLKAIEIFYPYKRIK